MTRNQLAVVQSLFVVGILLLLLGVATFFLAYIGVGSVLASLGVVAMLGAAGVWLRLSRAAATESADAGESITK